MSLRTNARKSSRRSSPFVRTANGSPAPIPDLKKERTQTSLDGWIEPDPRTPVPSFEDHGFERGGVVTTMAPLGALPPPNMRLKFRVKAPVEPKKEVEPLLSPIEVVSRTPEGSPPPATVESRGTMSHSVQEATPQPMAVQSQDRQNEEERVHTPNGAGGCTRPSLQNGTPTATQSRRTSTSRSTPYSNFKSTNQRPPSRTQRLEFIVEAAVDRSRAQGQLFLGLCVKRIYHESQHDPALADILDAILRQTPSEEQRTQFTRKMKSVKKQLKVEEASAKRLRKSQSRPLPSQSDRNNTANSTIGSMGNSTMASSVLVSHRHSGDSTIESAGSQTPPHPPPPVTFYPFPASVSSFRLPPRPVSSASLLQNTRSTTPPFPPSSYLTYGAGTADDTMVSTRRQLKQAAGSAGPLLGSALPAIAAPTAAPDTVPTVPFAPTQAVAAPTAASVATMPTAPGSSNTITPAATATNGKSRKRSASTSPADSTARKRLLQTSPAVDSVEVTEEHREPSRRSTRKAFTATTSPATDATAASSAFVVPSSPSSPPHVNKTLKSPRKAGADALASSTVTAPPASTSTSRAIKQPKSPRKLRSKSAALTPAPADDSGSASKVPSAAASPVVDASALEAAMPTSIMATTQTVDASEVSTPVNISSPAGEVTTPYGDATRRTREGSSAESELSAPDLEFIDRVENAADAENAKLLIESSPRSPKPKAAPRSKATLSKGKGKKNIAGSKRAAADVGLPLPDEATIKRQKNKESEYRSKNVANRAQWTDEATATLAEYRFDDEYQNARHGDSGEPASEAEDPPAAPTTSSSTAVAASARSTTARRTRESTQKQTSDITAANTPVLIPGPATPDRAEPPRKKRTKSSPTKKATGNSSPAIVIEDDEHDDICNVCEIDEDEVAELVMCDGTSDHKCRNVFHQLCWDPPLDEESPEIADASKTWQCYECHAKVANEDDSAEIIPGALGTVFSDLGAKNPQIFQLDDSIVKAFKWVGRGKEGKYMDEGDYRLMATQRNLTHAAAVDEMKNVAAEFSKKAGAPNIALCVVCGLSVQSMPNLLKCDVKECGATWHLDCLTDKVHTAVPFIEEIKVKNKKGQEVHEYRKEYFECPRHIDQNMRILNDPIILNDGQIHTRGIKIRKFNQPKLVTPAIERGLKNWGNIEINLSESEHEVEVPNTGGTTYKVSEHAVKLDFVTKAKRSVDPTLFKKAKTFFPSISRKKERKLQEEQNRIYKAQEPSDLLKLLHPEKAAEVEARVLASMNKEIDQRVQLALKTDASKAIHLDQPNAAEVLASICHAKDTYSITKVVKHNLSTLYQAATSVEGPEAAQGMITEGLSLDEIAKMEALLAVAKANAQARAIKVAQDETDAHAAAAMEAAQMERDEAEAGFTKRKAQEETAESSDRGSKRPRTR